MRDTTARRLSTLHTLAYRATRGRVGRRVVDNDMLLLTTVGRVTGKRHTVPLLYLSDEENAYVIASWGGRDSHPEWYLNLVANPAVTVQTDGRRYRAVASILDEPQRTEWWDRAVAAYDGYAAYQAKTDRIIPVVRLTASDRRLSS